MKVFISWSGDLSHKVAIVIRDWITSILQFVEPYVSSEDIDKGVRWSSDISKELDNSKFGILCVTKENFEAPWLNFEAGALGKSFESGRVSPFLFGIERSEVKGPILQFQSTIYDKDDVLKLIKSINQANIEKPLDEALIDKSFDLWWPKFKEELDKIEIKENSKTKKTQNKTDSVLEEILELSRRNQRLLNNPERLLPQEYLEMIVNRNRSYSGVRTYNHPVFRDLFLNYHELEDLVIQKLNLNPDITEENIKEIFEPLRRLGECIRYIERHSDFPNVKTGSRLRSFSTENFDNV
ncbi:TIR domain-containing protein [Treponema bryantii]|uniref:TIR domain-containing protein n=1 Tax=Treponema bryantii TaxID=163 RepID=A0A1H9JSA2_9SPIR|nr:toll/interleukin-1 receptor domain-containing protein [Treponema bryantii]BDC93198.1 hypothetical protein TRBR_12950 [Treponema bryantii]SEQ89707.1 TIR domain-containing protein [Treponema bryantii]